MIAMVPKKLFFYGYKKVLWFLFHLYFLWKENTSLIACPLPPYLRFNCIVSILHFSSLTNNRLGNTFHLRLYLPYSDVLQIALQDGKRVQGRFYEVSCNTRLIKLALHIFHRIHLRIPLFLSIKPMNTYLYSSPANQKMFSLSQRCILHGRLWID